MGLRQLGEPALYKIANNIENIQRDIHNLSTGCYKMKVIRYTEEDEEKEIKQLEETKQLLKMVNLPRKESKE